MTGQEAVKIAQGFDEALDVTGVVLTKMDGDARGGAALSIYGVTGKPIKFIGVGEKLDGLEDFHPERMAGRILQRATSSRWSRRRSAPSTRRRRRSWSAR
jgi:signal recognition particle subunit SRP54